MKVGLGIITLILTLVFSTIAINNNKLAVSIVEKSFGVKKDQTNKHKEAKETKTKVNNVTKTKTAKNSGNSEDLFGKNWDKDFEKKWNNF